MPSPPDSAVRSLLRLFGVLPKQVRRTIVRVLRPTWTAGAVAVIEREDGRWLFVRPVYRKGWTLPGGLVDRGESPTTSVVREMKEELGVDVTLANPGWVILDPYYRRVETVFRVDLEQGLDPDSIGITTPELSAMGWFDPAEPPSLEDETADVLELIRQIDAGGSPVLIRPETAH